MTVEELMEILALHDPSDIVAVDCQGYVMPAADEVVTNRVRHNGESYRVVILQSSDWPPS